MPYTWPLPSADRPHRNQLRRAHLAYPPAAQSLFVTRSFMLPCDQATLLGDLVLPPQATGLVLFAHTAGSCRRSSRSRHITRLLQQADLGTFSVDLLTPAEAQQQHRTPVADQVVRRRIRQVVRWLQQPGLLGMRLGLLGEGSAAAALLAASPQLGNVVGATVALGDLALAQAPAEAAPTLLLAGEADETGRQHHAQLASSPGGRCATQVVPQGDHHFQAPGTLAAAVQQAARWFTTYLSKPRPFPPTSCK